MKPSMRVPALVGIVLLTSALLACADISAESPSGLDRAPLVASTPIPPTEPAVTPGWADILGTTSAPDGWQVAPCENPILLCVTADGEFAGTVERFSYPLSDIKLATPMEPIPPAGPTFLVLPLPLTAGRSLLVKIRSCCASLPTGSSRVLSSALAIR